MLNYSKNLKMLDQDLTFKNACPYHLLVYYPENAVHKFMHVDSHGYVLVKNMITFQVY